MAVIDLWNLSSYNILGRKKAKVPVGKGKVMAKLIIFGCEGA